MSGGSIDIPSMRARLSGRKGRRYWRAIEEIADDPYFARALKSEFPAVAQLFDTDRRNLLKVMAASLALGGLAGCDVKRSDEAVPYVIQPDGMMPNDARRYATAVTLDGWAQPAVATCYAGRPVRLDGNADHPMSLGRADMFTQAAVLDLYDPDRGQAPLRAGLEAGWPLFETELATLRTRWLQTGGKGLALLCGPTTSPTLLGQIDALRRQMPQARFHMAHGPSTALRPQATRLAFGQLLEPMLELGRAKVIVSLDDDVLGPGPRQLRHSIAWAAHRGEDVAMADRIALHVAEVVPGHAGAMADSRIAVAPSRIWPLAAAIAHGVGVGTPMANLSPQEAIWVDRVVKMLKQHPGRSLFTVGATHAPEAQALGFAVNQALGNIGGMLWFAPSPAQDFGSIDDLAHDLHTGSVEALFILDTNPIDEAPADLDFPGAMKKAAIAIHAGSRPDETAALCHWHLPIRHVLEDWGDARATDGSVCLSQPLVQPLYDSRSRHEIIALLGSAQPLSARELVRRQWAALDDEQWTKALLAGFVEGQDWQPVSAQPRIPVAPPPPAADRGVEIVIRPDPTIWDGSRANNAWLQEMPKPLFKMAWDNIVAMGPEMIARLGVRDGDGVRISHGGATVDGPAWTVPGMAPNTIALFLGYGRGKVGRVGDNMGYPVAPVRKAATPWAMTGGAVVANGVRHVIAVSQLHHHIEGDDLIRVVDTIPPARSRREDPPSLYPKWKEEGPQWGMVIDLDRCTGCGACVVACTAENNVPVVGKEEVARGRDMHWLRVDRYHEGDPVQPSLTAFQPVPCMHCEQAPCEMGCPVHATVHGPDGINEMVYNRCIGTRTCSSFCPYKVRRFNWFDYTKGKPESVQAQRNPDVTVRGRGVMEKCTYCIQRVRAATVAADKGDGRIPRDTVKTACQATCPVDAIVFGDLADPESAVSRLKRSGRNYVLLEELGTRPRTSYLARIKPEDDDQGDERA